MAKEILTDEEVEMEISRLQESEAVKLARKEWWFKHRRRQYMNTLRWYERRGKELIAQGVTEANFMETIDMKEGLEAIERS